MTYRNFIRSLVEFSPRAFFAGSQGIYLEEKGQRLPQLLIIYCQRRKKCFLKRFNSLRKNKLMEPRKIKQTLTSMLVNTPERTNFDVPLHKVALTCGSHNPDPRGDTALSRGMSDPYADGNGPKIPLMLDPYVDGKRKIWPQVRSKVGPEVGGRCQGLVL